jgi:hypothetical protein
MIAVTQGPVAGAVVKQRPGATCGLEQFAACVALAMVCLGGSASPTLSQELAKRTRGRARPISES